MGTRKTKGRSTSPRRKEAQTSEKIQAAKPEAGEFNPDQDMELSPKHSQKQAHKQTAKQPDQAGHRQKRQDGLVRKSSLYLSSIICLVLGIYLGSLVPGLTGQQPVVPGAPGPSVAGEASSAKNAPSANENDAHMQELEQAVQKNPNDLPGWVQLGNHYFDANRPRDAIRAYGKALDIRPDNPDVLTDMGIMYQQIGEYEQALKNFRQAAGIAPLHEQSRFNQGVVLFFNLNRKDEARSVWQALLTLNPDAKMPDGTPLRSALNDLK